VFDGEIVALDEDGRPRFNDLLFARREPVYVAFDVLFVHGEDVRALPLKERKALLEKVVRRYGMQKSEPVLGDGKGGVPGGVRVRPGGGSGEAAGGFLRARSDQVVEDPQPGIFAEGRAGRAVRAAVKGSWRFPGR